MPTVDFVRGRSGAWFHPAVATKEKRSRALTRASRAAGVASVGAAFGRGYGDAKQTGKSDGEAIWAGMKAASVPAALGGVPHAHALFDHLGRRALSVAVLGAKQGNEVAALVGGIAGGALKATAVASRLAAPVVAPIMAGWGAYSGYKSDGVRGAVRGAVRAVDPTELGTIAGAKSGLAAKAVDALLGVPPPPPSTKARRWLLPLSRAGAQAGSPAGGKASGNDQYRSSEPPTRKELAEMEADEADAKAREARGEFFGHYSWLAVKEKQKRLGKIAGYPEHKAETDRLVYEIAREHERMESLYDEARARPSKAQAQRQLQQREQHQTRQIAYNIARLKPVAGSSHGFVSPTARKLIERSFWSLATYHSTRDAFERRKVREQMLQGGSSARRLHSFANPKLSGGGMRLLGPDEFGADVDKPAAAEVADVAASGMRNAALGTRFVQAAAVAAPFVTKAAIPLTLGAAAVSAGYYGVLAHRQGKPAGQIVKAMGFGAVDSLTVGQLQEGSLTRRALRAVAGQPAAPRLSDADKARLAEAEAHYEASHPGHQPQAGAGADGARPKRKGWSNAARIAAARARGANRLPYDGDPHAGMY